MEKGQTKEKRPRGKLMGKSNTPSLACEGKAVGTTSCRSWNPSGGKKGGLVLQDEYRQGGLLG